MRAELLLNGEQSVAQACYDAALHLEAQGHRFEDGISRCNTPLLLAYAPTARVNPFQSLLYRQAFGQGVAPVGVPSIWRLGECVWPGQKVVHFHWLNEVLKDAEDDEQAQQRLDRFEKLLDHLQTPSTTLLWTLHNVLPHDCVLPAWEAKVRQRLAQRVDAIHIMNPLTLDATRPYFAVEPHKVFHVPHPSYLGAYPNSVSREQARYELGVEPDAFVFLSFGAVRRYKGLLDLIEAFKLLESERRVGQERPVRLLIAGAANDEGLRGEIERQCAGRQGIRLTLGTIAAEHVQYFFNAADTCVLPYQRFLNSGVAVLARAFGKPTIMPRLPWMTDRRPDDPALHAPGDVQSLHGALNRAIAAVSPRRSASGTVLMQRPCHASDAFLAHVRRIANRCHSTASSVGASSSRANRSPETAHTG